MSGVNAQFLASSSKAVSVFADYSRLVDIDKDGMRHKKLVAAHFETSSLSIRSGLQEPMVVPHPEDLQTFKFMIDTTVTSNYNSFAAYFDVYGPRMSPQDLKSGLSYAWLKLNLAEDELYLCNSRLNDLGEYINREAGGIIQVTQLATTAKPVILNQQNVGTADTTELRAKVVEVTRTLRVKEPLRQAVGFGHP